jgi:hypothetical protein
LKPKVAYLRNPASSYWLNIINLSPHTRSKHQFATNTAVAAFLRPTLLVVVEWDLRKGILQRLKQNKNDIISAI